MLEYTIDEISKYHMSPYTRIINTPNGVVLHQTLFGEEYNLRIDPGQTEQLLRRLCLGCTKDGIQDVIDACFGQCGETVLKYLMLGGFIE